MRGSGSVLSFKHIETKPRAGKQQLMTTRAINSRVGPGAQVSGSFPYTMLCFLCAKFARMDSVSAVHSVIGAMAVRLINDPANPIRVSENHKLARSITNTGMVQFHMALQLLKRTLGPKINNSLSIVIRKNRKMSPFLFAAQVLQYNLNLGSRTFVAKQGQLRLNVSSEFTVLLKLGL